MKKKSYYFALLILISIKVNCQINLNQGLVAHWTFSGNAIDISGNNNNGTVNGVVPTIDINGIPNQAYYFDGNSYIEVANSASLNFPTDSFSIYTLVKPQGYYLGTCHGNSIIDKGNSDNIQGFYALRFDDGPYTNWANCANLVVDTAHQCFYIARINGALNPAPYTPYIVSNNWYCVIAICDGINLKLFVNGQLKSNIPVNGIPGTNNHNLFIGRKNSITYPYWFKGVIDEIRMYNRVLNTQEIDSLCAIVNVPTSVIANFSYVNISNCGSATYNFTDLSTTLNSNIISWNWDFGDGNTSTQQNPTHFYTASGTYNVKLKVTNNFNQSDSITQVVSVTVYPLPNVFASASSNSVCLGDPVTLNANGTANTYTWTGGVTNGVPFTPSNTNTYTVTGTDANGCTATSTVTVTVNAGLNVGITPNQPILCAGDSIMLTATGALNYVWNATPGLTNYNSATTWAYPAVNTTYIVTGSDANGCTGTASVTINVVDKITVLATKNRDVECGVNTIQLQGQGADTYTWSPAAVLSNPNAAWTNATITETTTFYLTGSVGSCVGTDSITVYVYNNDEASIYIPNAFSPNGDGNNDCLRIKHKAKFEKYFFTIYNRWGQKLFETDDPNACWDGYYNGKEQSLETYFYYLKAKTTCGDIFKKGDVIIVK